MHSSDIFKLHCAASLSVLANFGFLSRVNDVGFSNIIKISIFVAS